MKISKVSIVLLVFIFLLSLLPVGTGIQAETISVTIDGDTSSTTADDVSSISFAHTNGTGENRLMLVGVSWNCGTTGRTISSVTFTPDGEAAVGLDEVLTEQTGTQQRFSAIYSLLAPDNGASGNVTVTFSGSVSNGIVAGAVNFAGVDQTTPLGPSDGANASSTAPSVTLSGLDGDELIFDNVFQGASGETQTLTVGADQTELWNAWIANARAASSTENATGSSVTMSWTAASSSYWAITAVAINPVAGPTYDLTMAVDPVSGGTTSPAVGVHTYPENEVVAISATPNLGYVFDHWTGDVADSGSASTTVTMDEAQSVTAYFVAVPIYDLTMAVDPSEGGTTDPSVGIHSYSENEVVNITATPNTGYTFDQWTGDVADPYNASTTVTMDGNKTVTANFSAIEYDLTIIISGNGAVTKAPDQATYHYGDSVTLTPTADSGWEFTYWSGDLSGSDNPGTIVINGNNTVTAHFSEPSPLGLDGSVSSDTADGVSTVNVTHTTGTGTDRLMLVGVSSNSYNGAQSISSVTFTPSGGIATALSPVGSIENEAGRLAAIYSLLNPPANVSGTVTVTYSGSVAYGIVVGVANFAGVNQVDTFGDFVSAVGSGSSTTDVSVDVPTDVGDLVFDTAFIGGNPVPTMTVDASQTELWNATIDRARGVASIELATATTTPMTWSATSASGTYYWAIGAVPINPAFVGTTYDLTITVAPESSGTTDPSAGVHTYAEGTVVEITPTPATGYEFDQWSGDLSGSDIPGSVTMDAIKNVTANFTPIEYTLTINTVGNGSVTKNPDQATYHYGDVVELTAIADTDWRFVGWSDDLTGAINPSEITIIGNMSVTANFELDAYTLTINTLGNGSVTKNPDQATYHYGDSVELTAVADSGWVFTYWSDDLSGSINPETITINGNQTVTAHFSEPSLLGLDGPVSSNTADDVSSIDIPHTTGTGTDRLMLVGVSWNCGTTDRTITSIVFNDGTDHPLTEVITQLGYSTSNPRYSAIYSLLDPPAGASGTVTVTFSGSVSNGIMAGVANFAGVDQGDPLGTSGGAADNSEEASIILTELNGNELVFDNVFLGAGSDAYSLTAGADQTELWNPDYVANLRAAASTEQAAGSSVTMSWVVSTANYWAIAAVPINPAPVVTTYELTMASDPVAGGTATDLTGTSPYLADTVVDIKAEAAEGYHFVNWTALAGSFGDANLAETTFTMPSQNVTVTANFEIDTFTLNYAAGTGGSLTGDTSQIVSYGEDGTAVTAVPDSGYTFVKWSDESTDNSRTDTNVMANVDVTAIFEIAKGLLRVQTDPAVPTRIYLDGIQRNDWGLNWVKMPTGSYTLSFSDVYNFITPETVTVNYYPGTTGNVQSLATPIEIYEDTVTEVIVDFIELGNLRVETDPAMPATIYCDGVPMDDWAFWTNILPGEYTVSFEDLDGYITPEPQVVTVIAGATTHITGNYVAGSNPVAPVAHGLLRVQTDPGVPTTIFLDGIQRNDWGLNWVKMPAGSYTLSFSDVYGYNVPETVTVNYYPGTTGNVQSLATPIVIYEDTVTEVIVNFIELGNLRVETSPALPATIYRDGHIMDDWAFWCNIEPGEYTVSFETIDGMLTPPPLAVTVVAGATTHVIGNYDTGETNLQP